MGNSNRDKIILKVIKFISSLEPAPRSRINIIEKLLKYLHTSYDINILLYFDLVNKNELILNFAVPSYPINEDIKIHLVNLPIIQEVIKSGESAYINNISKYIFFRTDKNPVHFNFEPG